MPVNEFDFNVFEPFGTGIWSQLTVTFFFFFQHTVENEMRPTLTFARALQLSEQDHNRAVTLLYFEGLSE